VIGLRERHPAPEIHYDIKEGEGRREKIRLRESPSEASGVTSAGLGKEKVKETTDGERQQRGRKPRSSMKQRGQPSLSSNHLGETQHQTRASTH